MDNQKLLDKTLELCCKEIFNSVIIKLQFEHSVDNVIFNSVKCNFINEVKKCLKSFYCNIDKSCLYVRNVLSASGNEFK